MDNNEESETCWICLEGTEGTEARPGPLHANRLIQPCRCPRVVHSVCLAKWQLSQSGKSEEKFCRFCKERLPDWQENLALPGMAAVEPVMSVHFNGQTHMVKVKPGEEGRVAFIADVRRLLRLRENQEFSITFECKVPGHGMFLDLKGLSSYDAAVFCAAMTAVERQRLAAQKAHRAAAAGAAAGSDPGSAISAAASAISAGMSGAGSIATASNGAGSRPGLTASRSVRRGTGSLRRDAEALTDTGAAGSAAAGDSNNSAASDSDGAAGHEHRRPHRRASPSLLLSGSDVGSDSSGRSASEAETLPGSSGQPSSASDGAPQRGVASLGSAPGGLNRQPAPSSPTAPQQASAAGANSAPAGTAAGVAAATGMPERPLPHGPRQRGLEQRSHGACEVEPAVAAGLGLGLGLGLAAGREAGAAERGSDAASRSGVAGATSERRKASRHVWHGLALGSGHQPAAAGSAAAAGPGRAVEPLTAPVVGSRGSGAATWLTRLLTCAGSRTVAVYEPSR